jgi:hypothetical protein
VIGTSCQTASRALGQRNYDIDTRAFYVHGAEAGASCQVPDQDCSVRARCHSFSAVRSNRNGIHRSFVSFERLKKWVEHLRAIADSTQPGQPRRTTLSHQFARSQLHRAGLLEIKGLLEEQLRSVDKDVTSCSDKPQPVFKCSAL